ncbi:unnamed protein product [Scytosiphon promiscuus]
MSNKGPVISGRDIDQNGRPCGVGKESGQVTHQSQGRGGFALHYPNSGMNHGMGVAPTAWSGQPSAGPIAVIGDACKVDEWSEYLDSSSGVKYYHNPAKGTTTWDKPKGYVKAENAGKPAAPTKPKEHKPKYQTTRCGLDPEQPSSVNGEAAANFTRKIPFLSPARRLKPVDRSKSEVTAASGAKNDDCFQGLRRDANAPSPGEESTVLVEQFDSTPGTYPTSPGNDSGIQLRVGLGCLRDTQVAGPIIVKTDMRLLVESVGSWYLVSKVVDCHPSGSKFDVPLEFYFRVGEEFDEEDDGEAESCLEDEQLDEYRNIIQNTYKVLHREKNSDPWIPLGHEETSVVYEEGVLYIRAQFAHFSEGCLAKSTLIDNAYETERVSYGRPKQKQVEFVNATQKVLTFLVVPTSWSHSAITSFAIGVGVDGIVEANASVGRAIESHILTEAMAPQVFQIPRKKRQGDPRAGDRCTYCMCRLPESGGSEARVALVTIENGTVSVWFSVLVRERERLVVLPGQFSPDFEPSLGQHQLPKGHRLVDSTFTATTDGSIVIQNPPISSFSAMGGSDSANAGVDCEGDAS